MKTAWQALDDTWRDWYEHPTGLDGYHGDRRGLRAEGRRMVRALAGHDRATALHTLRVWRYAMRLADEMGFSREQREQFGLAARLHDVGKLGVPAALLNKPEQLTARETRWVREHVLFGERLVQAITPCPVVREAVRWHHERHDGLGYPDGLAGDRIPLFARLLAVIEAYDAMTAYRQHACPLTRHQALTRLRLDAGRQFHPDAVEAFAAAVPLCPAGTARLGRRFPVSATN